MKPRLTLTLTLALATLAMATVVAVRGSLSGQDLRESSNSGGFIKRIFRETVGETPKLGWLIPGQFLTESRAGTIFIYPRSGAPYSATFMSALTPEQRSNVRKQSRVACDLQPKDALYTFRVRADKGKGQAFYTTKPWPGSVVTGRVLVPLSAEQNTSIAALLKWTVPQRFQRHEAVAARTGSFYFSFHNRYDMVSGVIRQSATVLHDPHGQMFVVRQGTWKEDALCDGCAMPYLKDNETPTADVLNVFELDGFPYPVLLMDSSTVEGRALTFQTVRPDRKIDEFRLYEYVVNCWPLETALLRWPD